MSAVAPEPTVVCVLGTSRAGTSLTTRVLNLAGVYLGPREELLQKELRQLADRGEAALARAGDANPEGFWEHYRMMRLNERILRAFGGNWREPPELPPGWECSEKLGAERDEARALLAESFGGRPLWGWKDPRNSLTLPFWQLLLPEMRYLICLRNPVDVAASLQRRDGLPAERAFDLWLAYVTGALLNTSGRPRLLVPYERHFEDPPGTAASLAGFVGRDGAFDEEEVHSRLEEAVDERLWRNRTAVEDVVRTPSLPPEATALHLLTELLATVAPGPSDDCEGGLAAAVDLFAGRIMPARLWPTRSPLRGA